METIKVEMNENCALALSKDEARRIYDKLHNIFGKTVEDGWHYIDVDGQPTEDGWYLVKYGTENYSDTTLYFRGGRWYIDDDCFEWDNESAFGNSNTLGESYKKKGKL